jgi:hypothetical protein
MKISREQILMSAAIVLPLIGAAVGRYLPGARGPSTAVASIPIMSRPDAPEEEVASLDFQIPGSLDQSKNPVAKMYRLAHLKQFERTPLEKAPKFKVNSPVGQPSAKPATPNERFTDAMTAFKSFELTSILIGRETLAVIGGRPHKVGDSLKSGWKIIIIDSASSTVQLQHEVAGSQILKIRQHKPKGQEGTSGLEVVRRGDNGAPPTEFSPDKR